MITILQRMLLGVALLAAGCSNNLSESEARRLIESEPDYVEGVMCPVLLLRPLSSDVIYFVRSMPCAEALAAAHMIDGAGIPNIHGQGQVLLAQLPPLQGDDMLLPCATVRVVSVSGITTTGNTAEFQYDRDLVLNAGVADAANVCAFEAPEAGVQTRTRSARRDDAGNWSLVPIAR